MLVPIVALMVAATAPDAGAARPAAILTPGTISIAAVSEPASGGDVRAAFDDAVQRALSTARFTLLPGAHSRYVATIDVTCRSRGVVAAERSSGGPPRASLNGGLSVGLPAGGERLGDLIVTELRVTIALRNDPRVTWSGAATTARVSGTPTGNLALVAQTLANAVVAQFPGRADGVVSVP